MGTPDRRARVVAVALAAGLCGCQSAPEQFNAFPTSTISTAADFCARWAEPACARALECDPADHAALARRGSCTDGMTERCLRRHAASVAGMAMGTVALSASRAEACITDTRTASCTAAESAECGRVFSGLRQEDEACGHAAECAPGMSCQFGSPLCGACGSNTGSLTSPAPGDACSGSCGDGATLVCVGAFGLGQCVARAPEGGSCALVPCLPNLSCVGAGAAAVCVRPAALGERCDSTRATLPDCNGEGVRLHCDGSPGTCVRVRVAEPGASCGDEVICDRAHACISGSCTARVPTGGACTQHQDCADGACLGGTCWLRSLAGEPCTAYCNGLSCVAGACGINACSVPIPPDAGQAQRDAGNGGGP